MSAVAITLTSICSGGGHLTFNVTGDATLTRVLDISELTAPISEQDAESFLKVVARLAKMGRTNAQARTLLQAGVTVTV